MQFLKCQHRRRLDFFFSFFIFWLISWFTITVLISAVACLLCFKERWVERESVFTLSNRRSQKAPCPSHTVHSVFLELELLTVWCIWRPLNSFDIPSLLKKNHLWKISASWMNKSRVSFITLGVVEKLINSITFGDNCH